MKKFLAILMILALCLPMASIAAAGEYKGELKYMLAYQATDPNEEPPAKKLEELTGYKVTYYMLPSEGADEKLNLELSSGAEYDVIRISKSQFSTLAAKGAFVDLAPYLANTVNLKNIMSEQEWAAAAIDGKIYGIPQFDAYYVNGGIIYNTRMWLDAGFDLKDRGENRQLTMSEFLDILRKVKANEGVIPFVGNTAMSEVIASAFGIVRHDWQPDADGTITYRFLHKNMKDYISFMHTLWSEGLIDVEWPVNKGENVNEKFTSGKASAMFVHWASTTSIEAALMDATGDTADYLFPVSSDDGQVKFGSNAGVGNFGAIPKTSKKVEQVIDYLDTRADFKVFEESFLGVQGEQWEFRDTDGDGVMEYWPLLGEEHNPGFTAWFNGHYFNMVNSPESFTTLWLCRVRKGEVQYNATMKTNAFPKENWVDDALAYAPPIESVSRYAQSLKAFTDDYIVECIAGTRSIDEYEQVVAEFLADGGQEMIDDVNAYLAGL